MNLFKLKNFEFYKGFSEKCLIPPFYSNVYNNSNSKDFFNTNQNIDSYKNSVSIVNFIPPYFDLKIDDLKSDFELFKVDTHYGFLADFRSFKDTHEYITTQLSKKKLKVVNSRLNSLERNYKINYKVYIGEIDEELYNYLFEEFRLMIEKRFLQKKEAHVSIHNWNFYQKTAISMILDKKACLFVIYNEKKPIAISLNYLHQNIFDSAISTYDIDYSKFGLGNLTVLKKMEWCFLNGYSIFNMRSGDFEYKREWCNTVYKYQSHILFNRGQLRAKILAFIVSRLIMFKIYLRKKGVIS